MLQRAGECEPSLRNNILAWFWYSTMLRPLCKGKHFLGLIPGNLVLHRMGTLTCSSSCIVPTSGKPSITLAIMVSKAILCYFATILGISKYISSCHDLIVVLLWWILRFVVDVDAVIYFSFILGISETMVIFYLNDAIGIGSLKLHPSLSKQQNLNR